MNHPNNAQGWAMQSISTFTNKGVGISLNPATVSRSSHMLKFNYTNFINNINSTDISYISSKNNYEISLKYLNYGEFTRRNTKNESLGHYRIGDIYSRISWGTRITDSLYGGVNLHHGYSYFQQETANYLTSGFGLIYVLPSDITLGISTINQVLSGSSYSDDIDEPPTNYFIIGASKKLEYMPMRLGLDLIRNSENNYYANLGGDLDINHFNIYWGISSKREDLQTGDDITSMLAGISLGFSVDFNKYNYSFGFRNLGAMGTILSFTINRYLN